MFSRTVRIEISPEAQEAIDALRSDVQGLESLVSELLKVHVSLTRIINGELAVAVARATGDPVDGLSVFEGDQPPGEPSEPVLVENGPAESNAASKRPSLPEAMQSQTYEPTHFGDPDRVRSTPFTRAPRSAQAEWLAEYMADSKWYSAFGIAREIANDERHFRYLKGALSGRMREMHEDGILQRRDSKIKGSMFEYRLRPDHISRGPKKKEA